MWGSIFDPSIKNTPVRVNRRVGLTVQEFALEQFRRLHLKRAAYKLCPMDYYDI